MTGQARQSTQGDEPPVRSAVSPLSIFLEFTRLSLLGFGGVMPVARASLVDRNRWVDDRQFAEMLGVGQVMPGANIVNMGVMLGWRLAGWRGSIAAFAGLLLFPGALLLLIGASYGMVNSIPAVERAVAGMSNVAAGLIIATGLKLAFKQPRTLRALVGGSVAFLLITQLRWPLPQVIVLLVPPALLAEWWSVAKSGDRR